MVADLIAFYALAIIAVGSAVMVLEAKDIFHAALFLALLFAGIGGIYLLLTAEFIAAIQILIYAGAVVVLILFAIVLTKRSGLETSTLGKSMSLRLILIFVFIVLLIQPIIAVPWPTSLAAFPSPNTYNVGFALFTDYVIPFEIVSLALLAALIGAIYLSKREVTE